MGERERRQKKRRGEQGGLVLLGAASPYPLLFHQAPTSVCLSIPYCASGLFGHMQATERHKGDPAGPMNKDHKHV